MAFNVTQCPGCDSTFNTNARMLEMAAGKVRCGACLKVFDATEQYLANDPELDPIDSEESVFLSDDPQDYFDPSNFLTRSALTETEPEPDTEIPDQHPATEQTEEPRDTLSFNAHGDNLDEDELREEIIPEIKKDDRAEIEDVFADAAKRFQPADAIEEQQQEIGTGFLSGEESPEIIMLDEFDSAEAIPTQADSTPDYGLENIETEIDNDNLLSPEQAITPAHPVITEIVTTPQSSEDFQQSEPEPNQEQEQYRDAQEYTIDPEAVEQEQAAQQTVSSKIDPPDTITLNPTSFSHAVSISYGFSTPRAEDNASDTVANENKNDNESNKTKHHGIANQQTSSTDELAASSAEPLEGPGLGEAADVTGATDDPELSPFEELNFTEVVEKEIEESIDHISAALPEKPRNLDPQEDSAEQAEERDEHETALHRVLDNEQTQIQPIEQRDEIDQEDDTVDDNFHDIVAEFSEPPEIEKHNDNKKVITTEQDEFLQAVASEATGDFPEGTSEETFEETFEETLGGTTDKTFDGTIDEATDEITGRTTEKTFEKNVDETGQQSDRKLIDDFDTDQDDDATPTLDRDGVDYDSSDSIRARALKAKLEDDNALEAIPHEHLEILKKFSIPLELKKRQKSRWGRKILLSLIILLLCTTLAAQYFWENINIYSQLASTRQYYEFACQWLECNLADFSEIDAIVSDNLGVRSHPQLENGLMVNISIRNTASFPQAFPILILSFNSSNTSGNEMIALREFSPDEYLDAALRDIEMMPVMTPVQIELEIMDPGRDAVNYTLAFRRP